MIVKSDVAWGVLLLLASWVYILGHMSASFMTVDHWPCPPCCTSLLIFPLYNLDFGKHRRNECTLLILDCADLIKLVLFFFFFFFYLLKLIPALIFHPSKQRLIQLERRPFRPRSMGLGWADPGAFIWEELPGARSPLRMGFCSAQGPVTSSINTPGQHFSLPVTHPPSRSPPERRAVPDGSWTTDLGPFCFLWFGLWHSSRNRSPWWHLALSSHRQGKPEKPFSEMELNCQWICPHLEKRGRFGVATKAPLISVN